MDDYGIDKYIRKDEIYPETKLAKRLAPLSKKVDQTTREFRTYRIPIGMLRRRVKIPETYCLFNLKVPETLSYLPYDLPFSWKDPKYWKSLHRGGEYDEYATVIDEAGYVDPDQDLNEVFIYSTFNMLSKKDFFDTETGSWKIKNSYELEKAIDCTCTLVDIKAVLFDKKKLFNIEDKRKTVKGTEKGLVAHRNIANTGIQFDEDEDKLVGGKNEYLPFNCLIEWYVPYFDNETDKHGLFTADIQENGDYTFKDNKSWLVAYLKCLPKDYRPEKRITLLYRRYDERRENELIKEYALKSAFMQNMFREIEKKETEEPEIIQPILVEPELLQLEAIEIEAPEETKFSNINKLKLLSKFILNLKEGETKYINIKSYFDLIESFSNKFKFYMTYMEKETVYVTKKLNVFKEKLLGPERFENFLKNFQNYKGYKNFKDVFTNVENKNNLIAEITKFEVNPLLKFYFVMQKELYTEYTEKLHHMRRKICGRVIKAGKYDEVVWTFMSFKEPAKG